MSEYQFVHFLAIDRPLDDKQLAFMEKQSTRAEITPWEFTNEYDYGDFRGDAAEMLRRGYDVHLHYANFGIRRLLFRLPAGLPCDRSTFNAFEATDCVEWHADKKGRGGILEISPEADAGTYDEDLFDVDGLLHSIAPIRELLLAGDLRALYLAWLACAYDGDGLEPPVPAGLGKLPSALAAMASFYAISDDLISAAALHSPPAPKTSKAADTLKSWVGKRSPDDLRDLVQRLLSEDAGSARAETLARVRSETVAAAWPLAKPARTLAQLRESVEQIAKQRLESEARGQETAHKKRLKSIAAAPDQLIASVTKLVQQRSTQGYEQAAKDLADLREALGPERGPEQARAAAEKLRRANPTLKLLVRALREKGLLDK